MRLDASALYSMSICCLLVLSILYHLLLDEFCEMTREMSARPTHDCSIVGLRRPGVDDEILYRGDVSQVPVVDSSLHHVS